MHTHAHTYAHRRTQTYTHAHTYTDINTCTYIHRHTHMHIHTCTYIHAQTCTYIHTQTYIHAHRCRPKQTLHVTQYPYGQLFQIGRECHDLQHARGKLSNLGRAHSILRTVGVPKGLSHPNSQVLSAPRAFPCARMSVHDAKPAGFTCPVATPAGSAAQ